MSNIEIKRGRDSKITLWRKLDFFLVGGLIILSFITFLISLYLSGPLNGWLINISSGFISSLTIIFGIDALRFKRAEIRKKRGKDIAKKDLQRLANMFISYLLFPIGVLSHEQDSLSKEIGENWSSSTNELVLNKALQGDFIYYVSKISPDVLRNLKINFSMVSGELRDDLIFYAELVPSEIYGELLNVRRAFNEVITMFSLWEPFLFRQGDNHEMQYKTIADSLINYTMRVDDFTKVLGGW